MYWLLQNSKQKNMEILQFNNSNKIAAEMNLLTLTVSFVTSKISAVP